MSQITRAKRCLHDFFLPPVAIFILSRLVVSLAAWSEGFPLWSSSTWARGDSEHYYTIMRQGYTIFPCAKHIWCGNTGWFPAYPLLIRWLRNAWFSSGLIGLSLSASFFLLALTILWNGLLDSSYSPRMRWTALVLAGFFPGDIYFHALFPNSMVAAGLAGLIWFIKESRWISAFLTALTVSCCHPTGIWLTPAMILWAAFQARTKSIRESRAILAISLAPLLGFFLVCIYQRLDVGWWGACFTIHQADRLPPGWSWAKLWQILIIPSIYHPQGWVKTVILTQSLTLDALVIGFLIYAWRGAWRRWSKSQQVAMLCTVLFWVGPHLSFYHVSYYRNESFLIPLVLLIPTLPEPIDAALVAVFMGLSFSLALLFFRGWLV